ncbi:hypothetical protein JHK86_000882 [Glycine max]|nr:hypothetical protein JHK86_000882 [Glycine max]
MLEMESSDNFCSSVNGNSDNDVTEVYENDDDDEADEEDVDHNHVGDSDDQDDVGLEDEEEVNSEVDNDDYRDYDIFGFQHIGRCQHENYGKVGIRPLHMYAAFANHYGGYDKVEFIRKYIYNQEVCMRKLNSSDASGALKYLHDLRKKDPMMYVSYTMDEGSRLQQLFWCDAESQLLYEIIVFGAAIVTDETEETYVWLLQQFLEAMKGKAPCSIITNGDLAMRNTITRKLMLGDFEVIKFEEKWKEMVVTFELEDNSWIAELYEKRMKWSPAHLRTIKLRVIDCKEMVMFSVYTVVKYCSGSVWRVSYCPSTVHFSCCMRMQSIGLPCDHILAVLICLNFTELPSSLVLNRWSKSATENIKEKYPDSAMYWDSHLIGRYATLVQVSREVCEVAYCDKEEYDKMLHFLSNELRRLKSKKNSQPCFDENDDQQGDNCDGILDPVVVRTKGCGQVGIDESGKRRRIQKCGQCGGSGHNKRSCTNPPRNANVLVGGSFISSSEQTNTICQPTDEYNYELFMQHPHTFVAGSSCAGR